jgi:putative aldouronate transport system substrate-binding protein
MKRNKKYGAIALILVTAMIAGCSGKGGGSSASTNSPSPSGSASSPSASAATAKTAEPATLRILTEFSQSWPVKKDWAAWKWVKEKTNITVNQETWTGPESVALAIASGDMPDLFAIYTGDAQKYGAQGAFLDLSKYLDKMPNVKEFLKTHPDVAERMTSPDGQMYMLLNDGAGAGNQMVWFYRDDVFEKNNLKPPTTWDELYDTAKKLKQLYPSSYPFVFRHGIGTLNTFAPTFGMYPTFYPDPATGKIKFGATDPNFKKMIEYLNKFQNEGLIPPDWVSMDYKAWTQFITTNQSFMTVQFIGQIEIMNTQLQGNGHLKFMAPPSGVGNNKYIPRSNYEIGGTAVSSKTKNLDATLRYLDFMYSKEGRDIMSWGKEGETYTMQDGKRKLNPIFKEPNDLRKEAGIMTAGTYGWFDYSSVRSLSNANEQYSYEQADKYPFPVTSVMPMLKPEEQSSIATTLDQLSKFYESSMTKFILGETPMTQWDTFISDLDKNGLSKSLEVYQKAYDRIKAKK